MTWKQYWHAPFAKHCCPQCHQRFKVTTGLAYFCDRIVAVCLGGIPLGVLWFVLGYNPLWGWICGGFLTGVPIDKHLDNRSPTEKISESAHSRN